jgi:flagellar hook-length control protein FliK
MKSIAAIFSQPAKPPESTGTRTKSAGIGGGLSSKEPESFAKAFDQVSRDRTVSAQPAPRDEATVAPVDAEPALSPDGPHETKNEETHPVFAAAPEARSKVVPTSNGGVIPGESGEVPTAPAATAPATGGVQHAFPLIKVEMMPGVGSNVMLGTAPDPRLTTSADSATHREAATDARRRVTQGGSAPQSSTQVESVDVPRDPLGLIGSKAEGSPAPVHREAGVRNGEVGVGRTSSTIEESGEATAEASAQSGFGARGEPTGESAHRGEDRVIEGARSERGADVGSVFLTRSENGVAPGGFARHASVGEALGTPGSVGHQASTTSKASPVSGGFEWTRDSSGEKLIDAQLASGLAAALRQRGGTITLRLNPESLGAVRVEMRIEDGTVSARIDAVRDETRQVLRAGLDGLRAAIEERGLVVHRVEIADAPPGSGTVLAQGGEQKRSASESPAQGHESPARDRRDSHEGTGREAGGDDGADGTDDDQAGVWWEPPTGPAQTLLRLRVNTVA